MPGRFSSLSAWSLPRCAAIVLFTWCGWGAGSLGPAFCRAESPLPTADEPIRFNEHVRPILSNNCFYCHGPDESHREAGLRLDLAEEATADLGGGAAIVPGHPDESLLIERIIDDDPDMRMPPAHSKKPRLSEAEVAVLSRWIAEGADYQPHWAFAPLQSPVPPEVQDASWAQQPIDRFILARLERAGLEPSPEAPRETLIRRVSLDLTGLLPTPDEVRDFVEDPRPDAYERLVDRLLASPHFGERWGRHWLDQARYADSHGYTIDSARTMWPYRDWVLRAINDDMPFDQFTIEQLAGDLLPDPTLAQRVATGFHRNTLINQEGGVDQEQFRHEAVVDRVNTTAAVWLGLTLGCAQCHTHKFDPITHREYYELFAFFNSGTDVNNQGAVVSVERGEMLGVPRPAWIEQRRQEQREYESQLLARLQPASDSAESAEVSWQGVAYRSIEAEGDPVFTPRDDGSVLVEGQPDPKATFRVVAAAPTRSIAAARLRVLTDPSLPRQGPGRASNGNFVLTGFSARVGDQHHRPTAAVADHQQPGYPVTAAIDGDSKTGWAINVGPGSQTKMNADHEAVFVFDPPLEVPEDSEGAVEFHLEHALNADYLVGRFAIEVAETAPETMPADPQLLRALRTDPDRRSSAQSQQVVEALRQAYPDAADRFAISSRHPVMVMAELPEPRATFVSLRGDFLRPDESTGPLQPGGLAMVPPAMPAEPGRTRLDLARWLVSPDNPLTPRVTVNRIWMRYFGRGLVETEEDFGTQGSSPTHPQLLDWLASRFIEEGWSTKALHRGIVTSATYRQASVVRSDLLEKDARNRWLARQSRIRFEAEVVRDAALAASGLIDRTLGGPSVRPPQPEGVYAFTQNDKSWVADTGADRYRRAIYTEFYRSAPHPLFTTFDTPDLQTTCTRRARSNTPLQALTVANDQAFLEMARGLAQRVLRELPDAAPADRIDRAFQLCLSRSADAEELAILESYHEEVLAALGDDHERAHRLLGTESTGGEVSPLEAAAMLAVSRAILNTDNFITRE